MPMNTGLENESKTEDYILENDDRFIKWAGSKTVAIPYDIEHDKLEAILPQLNGAFFTGGNVELINRVTF